MRTSRFQQERTEPRGSVKAEGNSQGSLSEPFEPQPDTFSIKTSPNTSPESFGASPQAQNEGAQAGYWQQPLDYRRAAELCLNRCNNPSNMPQVVYGCILSPGTITPCVVLNNQSRCPALETIYPEIKPKDGPRSDPGSRSIHTAP